jgi:hypothetical protein
MCCNPIRTRSISRQTGGSRGRAGYPAGVRLHRSGPVRPPGPHGGVRRAAPDLAGLVERPAPRFRGLRRRRLLGGDQARRHHRRLQAQRCLLKLGEHRAHPLRREHRPGLHRDAAGDPAQHGPAAADQGARDRVPRLHAAIDQQHGGQPARAGRAHRRHRARRGNRRLRRRRRVRAAAAGDRRTDRRAAGGPEEDLRVVEPDDRLRRSGILRRRHHGGDGTADLRDGDGREPEGRTARRHHHQAGQRVDRRRGVVLGRVRLLRADARGRGQRDHPQRDLARDAGVLRPPGPVGAVQVGAAGDGGRRDHQVGHAGDGVPAHRDRRHRARRQADQAGAAGRPVLPVGQLRRGRLRSPRAVRHPARPQPAPGPGRFRRALLPGRQPGQARDRADLQRHRRRDAGHPPGGRPGAAAVRLAQRRQAAAGQLRGVLMASAKDYRPLHRDQRTASAEDRSGRTGTRRRS